MSSSSAGVTRRRFIALSAFAAMAAFIGKPLKGLAADKPGPVNIVIKSLNPKRNMPLIFRTEDDKGHKLVIKSSKDLTVDEANGRVTVSVLLPNHPDKKGDALNKLPFDVKNGEWSITKGASYKDGQRCDEDKDMADLARLMQERVKEAQTPLDTPMVCKIDDTSSVGILYRKGWATRADIHNTDLEVTASFDNDAFAGGKMGLGPIRWSVNGNQLGLSERITDIVNDMKLADPGKYTSDEKRALAATMTAIALREANVLKNIYRNEVVKRVDANGKRTREAEKMGDKDLVRDIGAMPITFSNPTDTASFQDAFKLPLDQAVAKLNKLLAGGAGPTAALNVGSGVAVAGMLGAGAKEESERPAMTRRAFLGLLKPSKGA